MLLENIQFLIVSKQSIGIGISYVFKVSFKLSLFICKRYFSYICKLPSSETGEMTVDCNCSFLYYRELCLFINQSNFSSSLVPPSRPLNLRAEMFEISRFLCFLSLLMNDKYGEYFVLKPIHNSEEKYLKKKAVYKH